MEKCQEQAQWLREPQESPYHFPKSECLVLGSVCASKDPDCEPRTYKGCVCYFNMTPDSGGFGLFPEESEDTCLHHGRATDCVYLESEFPGCSTDDAEHSCDPICEVLEQRIRDDYEATFDASVNDALCQDYRCCCALELEGNCYYGYRFDVAYDCSMSAGDICEAFFESYNLPTPEGCGCGGRYRHGSSWGGGGSPGMRLWIIGLALLVSIRCRRIWIEREIARASSRRVHEATHTPTP